MSRNKKKKGGVLIVDPAAGLSGDMFLGALFALGADYRKVTEDVSSLPGLEPFRIIFGRVKRKGISAVRARVVCGRSERSRDLKQILSMIKRSGLNPDVKKLSSKIFLALGTVEGKIHGVPVDKVHFHEVGAVDSIVDIVGSAVALSLLGFPEIYHRPFRLGGGIISISHGRLPVPAPATLELIKGRTVTFSGEEGEIVTPTGAAIMSTVAGEISGSAAVLPKRVVYSVGTRESAHGPGMLRVVEAEPDGKGPEVTVIRCTIDDMNPEVYGYVQERLFETGALEVYLTQVLMKKGRPGALLTVLCERDSKDRIISLIFRETSTIGMRITVEGRSELDRWKGSVDTRFGKIGLKYAALPDGSLRISPEYDSCRKAAIGSGAPISAVYEEARRLAENPGDKKDGRRKKGKI